MEDRRLLAIEPTMMAEILSPAQEEVLGVLPLPLDSLSPSGSLIYDRETTGALNLVGDVDSFTIDVDPDQTISVVVEPLDPGLDVEVSLRDPGAFVVATVDANGPDADEVLQSFGPTVAGTYTIDVISIAGSGAFGIHVVLNSAIENEKHDGPGNNTLGTAQDIATSFISLGGSADRGAVLGRTDPPAGTVYSGTLPPFPNVVFPNVLSADFTGVPVSPDGPGMLNFLVSADLGDTSEFLSIEAEGIPLGDIFVNDGLDLGIVMATINLTTAQMNALAADGTVSVTITPSADVDEFASFSILTLGLEIEGPDKQDDFFSFGLADGESATIALTSRNGDGAGLGLELLDSAGNPIAVGTDGAENVGKLISNFVATPANAGIFNVRVHATIATAIEYSLVVTRNADFDIEPNDDAASAQDISASGTVLGATETSQLFAEPDDFPAGTVLNNAVPGAVLSVVGEAVDVTTLQFPLTSTGTRLFGRGTSPVWFSSSNWLRADFTDTTSEVSIDVIGDDSFDPGILRAFDVNGVLLDEVITGAVPAGQPQTMTISRPQADIAFIQAAGQEGQSAALDNLRWMVDSLDAYSFEVISGDTLDIHTATPADGSGEFVNELDPAIELFDPTGTSVASDDNSAIDGRNAMLSHLATMTGTYTVHMTGVVNQGEYVLDVSGQTGGLLDFVVTATDPVDGAVQNVVPTEMIVEFSDGVLLSSLEASDLVVGGLAATDFTVVDGNTVVFDLPALAEGVHPVVIAGGDILDLQNTPIEAFNGQLTIDQTAPIVVSSSILEGEFVALGETGITIGFDEDLNVSVLGPSDATLVEMSLGLGLIPFTTFDYDPNTDLLTLGFDPLVEGTYRLTLGSSIGAFADLGGNPLDGEPDPVTTVPSGDGIPGGNFVVNFEVDSTLTAFPVPLVPKQPLGSLIYDPDLSGLMNFVGDVDSFTIDVDPGQTISVVVEPLDPGLDVEVSLRDPSAVVLATVDAGGPGADEVIQTIGPTVAGTYTIDVTSIAGSGTFQLRVVLNAAIESEEHGGPSNDTLATAQDIDVSFISLDGSAQRGAVLGSLLTPASTPDDWYALTLATGESFTAALTGELGGQANLELYLASGLLLATGLDGGSNVTSSISNFIAPVPGTYYLRATGEGQDYSLVALRGATIGLEPFDSFDTAQDISETGGALGHVLAPSPTSTPLFGQGAERGGAILQSDVQVPDVKMPEVQLLPLARTDLPGFYPGLLSRGLVPNSTAVRDTGGAADETFDLVAPVPLQLDGPIELLQDFPGPTDNRFIPPDPTSAVGPDQVVTLVNTRIAAYDKDTGAELFNADLSGPAGFFGSVGATTSVFDPWVVYDTDSGRFFAVGIDIASSVESNVFLAVSTDSTPTTAADWHKYKIDFTDFTPSLGSGAHFPDYPKMAVDGDAVWISGNYFPIASGSGVYAGVTALEKTSLLSGGPANIVYDEKFPSFSVFPVQHYGDAGAQYFVEASFSGGSSLTIHAVTDVLSSPVRTTSVISVPSFQFPVDVPQLGSGATADAIDARIMTGVWRDGSIWTGHAIRDPAIGDNEDVVRWYQIDTQSFPTGGTPVLAQSGNVDPGPDLYAWMPAITVDRAGNMGVGFAIGGPNQFFGAAFTGRLATDPPGTTILPPGILHEGEAVYTGGRWGDYTGLAIDPADDATFWVFNEYAVAGGSGWATHVGAFQLASPVEEDWYKFDVNSGDLLELETFTPADGSGEFVNLLDPLIELYDPTGALVASDDNSAADGRNAALSHLASMTGTYRARVLAVETEGEYFLQVSGATADGAPPEVIASNPDNGQILLDFPLTYTLDFSEALVDLSVSPDDIFIGGLPAISVASNDGDTYEFEINPLVNVGDGVYSVVMAANQVVDLQFSGNVPFAGTFTVDSTGPTILSTTWNGGSFPATMTFPEGPLGFEAQFDEDLATVASARLGPLAPGADDVLLFENLSGELRFPDFVDFDPVADIFSADFETLPEGNYTLTLVSGDAAFEDLIGNDMDGEPLGASLDGTPSGDGVPGGDYFIDFIVDRETVAALEFERLNPLGGLIFASRDNRGLINSAADEDGYSFFAVRGETLTAVVTPLDPTATLSIELVGLVAPILAAGPGEPVVLPIVPLATDDTYEIRIGGDLAGANYDLDIYRNAVLEVPDSDDGAELAIDDSFVDLGSGRFGLVGNSTMREIGVDGLVWGVRPATGEIIKIDPSTGLVVDAFLAPDALAPGHTQIGLTIAEDGESLLYLNSDVDPTKLYRLNPFFGDVLSVESVQGSTVDGLGYESDVNFVFSEDFEGGLGGFTIDNSFGSGSGLWHSSTGRGNNIGHSPTTSLYYGQNEGPNGGGNYDTGTANGGAVFSPLINMPNEPSLELSFNFFLETENLSSFDVASVAVDDGFGFVTILSSAFGSLPTGTSGVWSTATANLSAYAGDDIVLRFSFDTLDPVANTFEGWYVDDVAIRAGGVGSDAIFLGHKQADIHRKEGFAGAETFFWATGAPIGGIGGDDAGRQFSFFTDGMIHEFDPATDTDSFINSFAPPASDVEGLAFDGQHLYASTASGELWTLNPDTGAVLNMVPVPDGALFGLGAILVEPVGTELIVNGGFETGSFTGWTAINNGVAELTSWTVGPAGGGFFGSTSPLSGAFDAYNGFDGNAGLVYELYQDVTIPAGATAELTTNHRIVFNSLGISSFSDRLFDISIRDTSNAVLSALYSESITMNGAPFTDLGWNTQVFDVSAFAGSTVRVHFREFIPESFTGPAHLEIDDVSLQLLTTATTQAQVQVPEVDEYTVDLTGKQGQPIDILLSGGGLAGGGGAEPITSETEPNDDGVPGGSLDDLAFANDWSGSFLPIGGDDHQATLTGTISAGSDVDWDFFKIFASPGDTLVVAMDGISLFDPLLRLFDNTGAQIAVNDDGGPGLNSLLTYSAFSYAGDYYVVADSFGGSSGTYQLTATLTTDDLLGESQDGVDFSESTTFELLDVDGTTVLATATRGLPVLTAVDATNYNLAILDFVVPADGVYTLRVRSALTGEYAVVVTDPLAFDSEPNEDFVHDALRSLNDLDGALGYLDARPAPAVGDFDFVLDPAFSSLVVTGDLDGLPILEQLPGSLVPEFEGSIHVTLDADSISFAGGSIIDAIEKPDPFLPSSSPADFAVTTPVINAVAAFREIVFDALGGELPLDAAGNFSAADMSISIIDGRIDFEIPGFISGSESLVGTNIDNVIVLPGTVERFADRAELTIPFSGVAVFVEPNTGATLTVNFDGQFFGAAPLDPPADTIDYYEIDLVAGQMVTIETATPLDSGSDPVNDLDPSLTVVFDLFAPPIAADDNSAADGKNALLSFVAPQSGTYRIGVSGQSGHGEYVLHVDAAAPLVAEVLVSGTSWSPSFLQQLESNGMGSGGYAIPVGSGEQLRSLSWTGIDQIHVVFSEEVVVGLNDLSLMEANGVDYTAISLATGPGPAPGTFMATWTLQEAIDADKLRIVLDDAIHDLAGNPLDGEWDDPTDLTDPTSSSYPSGDGVPGGDFSFRFNVLPADGNGDDFVDAADYTLWANEFNAQGQGNYNADDLIDGGDYTIWANRFGTALPAGEPAMSPISSAAVVALLSQEADTIDASNALAPVTASVGDSETAARLGLAIALPRSGADGMLGMLGVRVSSQPPAAPPASSPSPVPTVERTDPSEGNARRSAPAAETVTDELIDSLAVSRSRAVHSRAATEAWDAAIIDLMDPLESIRR